jgi:predicted methyltransferase
MYDQSKLSELTRFARVEAGSVVIDVYPGDGDWTRLFSDIVGLAALALTNCFKWLYRNFRLISALQQKTVQQRSNPVVDPELRRFLSGI